MMITTSKLNVQNDKKLTYDVYNGAQRLWQHAIATKTTMSRIIMLTLESVQHDLENTDLDYGQMRMLTGWKKKQSQSQNHINPCMIDTVA